MIKVSQKTAKNSRELQVQCILSYNLALVDKQGSDMHS